MSETAALPPGGIPRINAQQLYAGLDDWTSSVEREVERRVAMLMERPFHLLALDLEHLDKHVRQTPAQLAYLGTIAARLVRVEQEAKRILRRKEAEAYMRISKSLDPDTGKKWLVGQIDAQVVLDKEVDAANQQLIRAMEMKRAVDALVDGLSRKAQFIPGLQGAQNTIERFNSM